MPTKDILPPEANWLTPYLTVSDAEKSLSFYEAAFGFGRGNVVLGTDGAIMHAEMTWQGKNVIMFSPETTASAMPMKTPAHSCLQMPVVFYIYCADVDALTVRARRAGATVLSEPENMFWGDRMASLRDPDGYMWSFATRLGEFASAPEDRRQQK